MPANPLLDEKLLQMHLSDVNHPVTPDQIRYLCNLALLAAFDRKVTREFVVEIINLCTEIQTLCSQLETAGALRYSLLTLDKRREPALIDDAVQNIVVQFMRTRQTLSERVGLLAQCPTEADIVS